MAQISTNQEQIRAAKRQEVSKHRWDTPAREDWGEQQQQAMQSRLQQQAAADSLAKRRLQWQGAEDQLHPWQRDQEERARLQWIEQQAIRMHQQQQQQRDEAARQERLHHQREAAHALCRASFHLFQAGHEEQANMAWSLGQMQVGDAEMRRMMAMGGNPRQ
ncbi:Hypothetical predicted protein [Lecanosticta acicola]|uniref:Uncharacterized protein n=1 Tax=Lecanosticta acicola TaxID=111012 RepID=A0AAI9EBB0_9PEZI|nr:Hypothetical predicted protein [Lecanosticta acicola]